MAEVEFITIGDLHLGAFGSLFPESNDPDQYVYEAIDMIVDYARENGVKVLIFLGDLFEDPDPTQQQINRLIQLFVTLARTFEVHAIPGNHDYEYIGRNSLETLDFIARMFSIKNFYLHMRPARMLVGGVPFSFMPWPYHDKSKAGLKTKPSINIAHIEVAGGITDHGHKLKKGYKLDTAEDFWIIGHLHRRQRHALVDKRWRIFYPGTLYQKTFGEPMPKGFGHYTARYKAGVLSLSEKWRPIMPPFLLENIRIESPEDLKKVQQQIEPRPILRYKLFVKNNVALPPNFLTDNPHVVKTEGWRNKEELKQIEKGSVGVINMPPLDLDEIVYADLQPFLREFGLNKVERKKARHIVQGIVSRLSTQSHKDDKNVTE